MLLSAEDVIGTSNDFPCTIADFDEHYTLPPYNSKLIILDKCARINDGAGFGDIMNGGHLYTGSEST